MLIQIKQLPHRLSGGFYFGEFFISEQSQSKSGGDPARQETSRKYNDCFKHLIIQFGHKKFRLYPHAARLDSESCLVTAISSGRRPSPLALSGLTSIASPPPWGEHGICWMIGGAPGVADGHL